ncbi:hypothetical protein CN553_12270 [Bacillus cereus]|uniref:Uncharacterized protein n=1 Tax=Bacillus cereus TaxID=1396 RepID=A0A9X6UC60_BACCE|nr:hypothetical protein [Bacillus cereus]PEN97817.1 hypothetical protein CN553_12270 [Bacillus cereus]
MEENVKDNTKFYKLPYDEVADKDIDDWLKSIPRNKKAEAVRYAIRFYKAHLGEGEFFKLPNMVGSPVPAPEAKPEPKKKVGIKKQPSALIQTMKTPKED